MSTLLEQQGTLTPLGMRPYAILADTLTLLSSLVRKGYARIVRRKNEKEKDIVKDYVFANENSG